MAPPGVARWLNDGKEKQVLLLCVWDGREKREDPVSVYFPQCTSDLAPEPQTVSHRISHAPPVRSDHHLGCSAAIVFTLCHLKVDLCCLCGGGSKKLK